MSSPSCSINPTEPHHHAVKAVLLLGDRYVLQLRDDIPDIAWPGSWAQFGGGVEPDETPGEAIAREIEEELELQLEFTLLWVDDYYSPFVDSMVRAWIYEARVDDVWHQHRLHEGQAAGVFAYDALPVDNLVPIARAITERHYMAVPMRTPTYNR